MRLNTINWNDLKYFLEIGVEKSLSRAASRLGVTHSTVFRRINKLESDIGAKLFFRKPDGYHLTEVGKEVFSHTIHVRSHIDDIHRLLDKRSDELHGNIYITAPHNIAYNFIPKYISSFHEMHPDICINLMVSNKEYNLSRLEADLAIRATSEPPLELIGRKIFSLQWGAYAAPKYIEQHGRAKELADLKQHLLINSDQTLIKLPAFTLLEESILKSNIIMRCNDLVSMSAFAESGLGIAFLPDDQAKPGLIKLFELPKEITSELWLLIHPDMRQCTRLIIFRNFLLSRFRNDPLFVKYGIVDEHAL